MVEVGGEGEREREVAADEVEEAGREDNGVAVSSPAGRRKEGEGRKWVLSQCYCLCQVVPGYTNHINCAYCHSTQLVYIYIHTPSLPPPLFSSFTHSYTHTHTLSLSTSLYDRSSGSFTIICTQEINSGYCPNNWDSRPVASQ